MVRVREIGVGKVAAHKRLKTKSYPKYFHIWQYQNIPIKGKKSENDKGTRGA
jgi:hypothetical protein